MREHREVTDTPRTDAMLDPVGTKSDMNTTT